MHILAYKASADRMKSFSRLMLAKHNVAAERILQI